MPDPAVYDLSNRTNFGGLFLSSEYVSNFVCGESFEMIRQIARSPKQIVSLQFIAKATKLFSSVIVLSKNITGLVSSDGVLVANNDATWLATFAFSPLETAKLSKKLHFFVEALFDDGTTMIASQGFVQGEGQQVGTIAQPARIEIQNLPGSTGLGRLQITAVVFDSNNNVLNTVTVQFFTSDPTKATVDDTGLVNAIAVTGPAGVIITAATSQGNLATRATLVIT